MAQEIEDNTIYVAVGKDAAESKITLSWALKNFPGKKFSIAHVHQPTDLIPMVAGSFPTAKLGELEHRVLHELESQILHKMLNDYLLIYDQAGVHAEKLYIEMDDVGEGIVKLVYQHNIKKLVMGAAASKHYTERMTDLKSKKAIYVRQRVPLSCQIWFTCNGHLIHTGGSRLSEAASLSLQSSSSFEFGQSSSHLAEPSELMALPTQAMVVAEQSSRDAFGESVRHRQAERTSFIENTCKVRALESLYTEELRRRKEVEEELAKVKEKFKMQTEWNENHLSIKDQKLALELQVANLSQMVKEEKDKVLSAEEVSKAYKKERDDLQVERDNALRVTEELLKRQAESTSSLDMNQLFSDFSFSEIQDATCDFDLSSKIGEGAYGTLYKGVLRHTPVVIKVQDPQEFRQEVDLMSKLRHPNLVTLIGICPEACALIYEYLPNGSLRDRLSCKDNTPPLSWQTRVRIATDLCGVLIFLHSSNPYAIVHGDLKPANILLDANFACKLSNFGICRTSTLSNVTQNEGTELGNTPSCLDPHFLETGELSALSDVYSFGMILLQLLTGPSSFLDIGQEVGAVLDEGNLNALLDPLAGEWPFVQANQLAHLASRCCAMNPNNRPDLGSEVWRVLEPMRSSCGACSLVPLTPEERSRPPSYFVCPIYQEVMENPRVAADGYTYEEEAVLGWFESGRDTSPMTNLELDHLNLVPNYALRSAIREWQERH